MNADEHHILSFSSLFLWPLHHSITLKKGGRGPARLSSVSLGDTTWLSPSQFSVI